ncbi:MAG: DUF4838 domain-containing protein [Treponema sp.]|jgi:hypothetical protein|nr:DUF4838 domain-containing protein [Treponema sp.]
MFFFDVSKDWLILCPLNENVARQAADELVRAISFLRRQAGLPPKQTDIADALGPAPDDSVPVIIFNFENRGAGELRIGFSWRFGKDRIEFHGESAPGLCNCVFHFLDQLGFRWPNPAREKLPQVDLVRPGQYLLASSSAYQPSRKPDIAKRRRLVISRNDFFMFSPKDAENLLLWAARNRIDALILPLDKNNSSSHLFGKIQGFRDALLNEAKKYGLIIERGGWDLSFFVPRRYFFINRGIFRMDSGKRRMRYNFCPTNPDTIALLTEEAKKCFQSHPNVQVFHLWPDRFHEMSWCSCPSCRAFTMEEQNRIAVNTAADALKAVNPNAFISFYERPGEECDIPLRDNLFRQEYLPGEDREIWPLEAPGVFLIENVKK